MKRKCASCNRKVPIGFDECTLCLSLYCRYHRLTFQHDCKPDDRLREKIKKENPKIVKAKVVVF